MHEDSVLACKTEVGGCGGTPVSTSALKTLELLEIMCALKEPAGVSELARQIGSSRSTTHRRLTTLLEAGFVEQNRHSQYSISLFTARLGNAALEQAGLGAWLQVILERLAVETSETATVAALHRGSALIVQRAESNEILNVTIQVGTWMPLYYGASALILQAFAQDRADRDRLRASGLELATEEDIAAVHHAGMATSIDEFVKGLSAVSIPIETQGPQGIAALTIVCPTIRFNSGKLYNALLKARSEIKHVRPSLITTQNGPHGPRNHVILSRKRKVPE